MRHHLFAVEQAVGTRLIYSGIHKALQAHSAHAETFAFMFGYKGKYNLATLAGIQSSNWGKVKISMSCWCNNNLLL